MLDIMKDRVVSGQAVDSARQAIGIADAINAKQHRALDVLLKAMRRVANESTHNPNAVDAMTRVSEWANDALEAIGDKIAAPTPTPHGGESAV